MTKEILTQARLKELVHYNEKTGRMIWLEKPSSRANRVKIGHTVGNINHAIGGYRETQLYQVRYRMHRLIWLYMAGSLPKNHIDHINGDRLDNRWLNLRDVTRRENQKNMKIRNDNKSGIVGVHFDKGRNKWMAYINLPNKRKHLGRFKTKLEAINVRKQAEVEYEYHVNHGLARIV